ncbi:MAG: cupin domain-containing protein [Actinobacteria bacterium]|nr:cupin domain-containing protein [Actinomycetota bacterium]MCI0545026.1 cupin domain-containing protein [Actinomycetota bacterium]
MSDLVILDDLRTLELDNSRPKIYDRDIGLRLLATDPVTGAEHYLVRYPPGLQARRHTHTSAQTFLVIEGKLEVNGQHLLPGGYARVPGGVPMLHGPSGDGDCLFLTVFDGPFDVNIVD